MGEPVVGGGSPRYVGGRGRRGDHDRSRIVAAGMVAITCEAVAGRAGSRSWEERGVGNGSKPAAVAGGGRKARAAGPVPTPAGGGAASDEGEAPAGVAG